MVAYTDKPGTSMFSIKVKARKGQDEKDSSAQIDQITDALKHMDATAASDHRADLNTESVGAIAGHLGQDQPPGRARATRRPAPWPTSPG